MRPIIALFGLILAALLAVSVAGALSTRDTYDPAEYARQEAEIARYEAEAARLEAAARRDAALQPVDLLVASIWRVLPLGIALVGLTSLGLYLWALGVAHTRRVFLERRPDERGLLPVEAVQLAHVAPAALSAYHLARVEEARRPVVPVVPHNITYHHAPRIAGGALDPAAILPGDVAPADTPTFRALLDAGRIGRNNPMLLGHDAESGALVEGSWLDLYSCGLGGLSGSGKTWTAVFLACQAALFGTKIVLLDPHAGSAESLAERLSPLASRFVCAPAESPREMLAAVELVAEDLRARKSGRRGDPMLFIADEYSALQRGELAEPLAQLVEGLGQEGRKLSLFAMVAGQIWTASRAGGTEVRDSLASAYVHRCRPAQARYLTGMTAADLPPDLLELPAGTAYLLNTAGDFRRVTIPRMTPDDLGRVAEILGGVPTSGRAAGDGSTGPGARSLGFRAQAAGSAAAQARPGRGPDSGPARASASESPGPALDAEAARILAKFAGGASVHDLAAEIAGDANPGSRKYKAARERVEALLRRLAAQGKGAADA